MIHKKRSLFTLCIFYITLSASAQDAIIFRDGRVKSVKIIQTNNDKTLFKESDNKKATEEYVESFYAEVQDSRKRGVQ